MRTAAMALLLTLPSILPLAAQPNPITPVLDTFIEGGMRDWQIPGLSVVVVKDGVVLYEKGFGVRELGKPGKVDADTLFGMMSTTKAMTALAIGVLVEEKKLDWDDPVNDKVGNILLSRAMGADVRLDPAGFDIGFRDSWNRAIEDVKAAGGTPYAIPAGASDHRLGGLGFANWAYEVQQQEQALGVFFDTIIVCSVTGSTHAGMIAGFAGQDRPRRVLGIDASATLEATREQVARIARNTAELIGLGRDLRDDEITVLEGWAGDLYGIPVQSTIDAILLTGRLEGVILDPVYEGKSMAGLIDLVGSGEIGPDSTVLYAHLGGQPALNAYSSIIPV